MKFMPRFGARNRARTALITGLVGCTLTLGIAGAPTASASPGWPPAWFSCGATKYGQLHFWASGGYIDFGFGATPHAASYTNNRRVFPTGWRSVYLNTPGGALHSGYYAKWISPGTVSHIRLECISPN